MENSRVDKAAFSGNHLEGFTAGTDPDPAFQKDKNFQLPVPVGGNQAGGIAVDISLIGDEIKGRMFQFVDLLLSGFMGTKERLWIIGISFLKSRFSYSIGRFCKSGKAYFSLYS